MLVMAVDTVLICRSNAGAVNKMLGVGSYNTLVNFKPVETGGQSSNQLFCKLTNKNANCIHSQLNQQNVTRVT